MCHCSSPCGCNSTCFCGFVIPLKIGTVFAAIQVMICGFSFPIMSVLFWPQSYILVPSVIVSVLVFSLAVFLLVNMKLKNYIIFRIVIYGILSAFTIGCIVIIIGLNADVDRSSKELIEGFRKLFNVNTTEKIAFQMLQSIQIVYFSALFFSYVYCGMVFQLYEMKYKENAWRRQSVVTIETTEKDDGTGKVSILRKPQDGEPGMHTKQPKDKTVRIILPDP